MRRSSIALLLFALLEVVACSRSSATEGSLPAPPRSSAAAGSPSDETPMRGWQEGQEYAYRFQTNCLIALGDKTPLYDFDLSADARLLALKVNPDSVSFYLKLDGAKFVSRTPKSQPEFDRLVPQLKHPYFFEMKGGLVTAASFPKDLHPLAVAVFRSFSASLQFAAVAGRPHSFTTREFDTTGQYEAEYTPSTDPLVWSKRKQRYLGILLGDHESKEAKEIAPKVVESKAEIRLSPEGRPIQISQRDQLELANAQAPLNSDTKVSLLAESVRPSAQPIGELLATRDAGIKLAANAPYESDADRANLDEAKIDGLTFEKVLGSFEQIAMRPKSDAEHQTLDAKRAEFKKQSDEEAKLFVALGALFRAQPNNIQKAVDKIKAKSVARDSLVDALGSTGTVAAQDTLIALVKSPSSDKMLKARAVLSLARTENPSPASVRALLGLIDDEVLGTEALYGIGNYTRAFSVSGRPDAAKTLGTVLTHRLETAKSEMRVIEALRAVANSGVDAAFGRVKPYLKDPREQVRVDAVLALGLMTAPEIDAMLVERLTLDTAKKVRLAAVEAMGRRNPNDVLVAGLRENVTTDDPHVRYRAVEMMIRWLPKRGELLSSVQTVAQNDSEPQIRELAKAAL